MGSTGASKSAGLGYGGYATRDDAVNAFEQDTGIKITFNYNDDNVITKTNLAMVLNTVADMKRRFPQQLQWLKSVGSYMEKPRGGGMSMARASMANSIEFNEYCFSMHNPKLEKMYQATTYGNNPYHPKNTTAKDIITHELGHIMFYGYMRRMNRRLTGHSAFDLYDVAHWANTKGVRGGTGVTATHIKNKLNQALANALGTTPKNKNILKYADPRGGSSVAISGYAATNIHELFAESVADYVANGNNASPLSKEVVKILHL